MRILRETLFVSVVVVTMTAYASCLLPLKADDSLKGPGHPTAPYPNTFFDSDPYHPWNRLYGMLFIRPGLDGKLYGLNEVDPVYWETTQYLLKAPIHEQAIAAMDVFIQSKSAGLIKEPLRRALLQRLLWSLFDHFAPLHDEPTPEREQIETRLVKIMKSVALTDEELKTLPDNYQQEVAAGFYPTTFDPAHAEMPFLPGGFFSHGDWVELTNGLGPTSAPVHVQAVSCRSAFHVLISLPGGREPTLAYLKKLNEFEPHWTYDWAKVAGPNRLSFEPNPPASNPGPWVNPDLPQVPLFTRFALVRTANLINCKGDVANSPLVETIQVRVIRSMKSGYADSQAFEMLTLDQTKLMEVKPSLIALRKGDKSYDFVLNRFLTGGGDDVLESPSPMVSSPNGKIDPLDSCFSCHSGGAGILTMNSYRQLFDETTLKPPELREGDGGPDAAGRKGREYNWGRLQSYWFGDE